MTAQMPESVLPSPERLMSLLVDSGWQVVGGRGNLYCRLQPPGGELDARQRSLLVPLLTEAPDFSELMIEALDTLRGLPSESEVATILSRLTARPTDQFAFSKETTAPTGWIQWGEGESLVTSARGLLVAGAKTSRERLTYFGNRYGQFARRFLDDVLMGQTGVGSYVVRAYVPVDGEVLTRGGRDAKEGAHFVGQDVVASREISRTVVVTLTSAVEAIDHYKSSKSLSAFHEPQFGLSYESVTAIKKIAQDSDHARIAVTWAPAEPASSSRAAEQEFTFTPAAVPILERAAIELARPEPSRRVKATGKVHLLSRSESEGPGVIGMTTLSGEPAKKLRVRLESDDYHRALSAHDDGSVVHVEGDLEKEGTMAWLYRAHVAGIERAQPDHTSDASDQRLF